MTFKCWSPDEGQTEENANERLAFDARDAAKEFVDAFHADHDYTTAEQRVAVRDGERVRYFKVLAEQTWSFTATEEAPF